MARTTPNRLALAMLRMGAILPLLGPSSGFSQTAPPTQPATLPGAALPAPRPLAADAPAAAPNAGSLPAYPINLPTALRLAFTSNLDIAQARETVNQVQARFDRARVSILPNFGIGSAYNHHEGNIQKTEGNIIKANRDALFVGGGPSLTFSTTEAIFAPLAARQLAASAQAGLIRVDQDTLLAVTDVYLNVLRARRRVARINETLEQLVSERASPMRGQSKGLLPLIQAFVAGGAKEAFPADLERVRVEVLRRRDELVGALDELHLASAELARLLRLDPAIPLEPVEDIRFPLPVPVDGWPERPLAELVEVALRSRPELAENQALIAAALARVRAAQYRPLLPNVVLNYNWGDFGGGPDLNNPVILPPATKGGPPRVVAVPGFGPSGRIRHFDTRTDLDASLVWRLDNLGLGNVAELREQRSLHQFAILRELQAQDRVIAQVVQARELVQAWRDRLKINQSALFDAKGAPEGPVFRSLRLNFERIRGGEGRPLEVLDSVRGLSDSLEAYGQAVTDYERAQMRLLYALGVPLQALWHEGTPPEKHEAVINKR